MSLGTRTDQYIVQIKEVLGDKEMTSKEVLDAFYNSKTRKNTSRRLIPTYRQVVALLKNPTNFIEVKSEDLPRGRKLRIYKVNKNAMDRKIQTKQTK